MTLVVYMHVFFHVGGSPPRHLAEAHRKINSENMQTPHKKSRVGPKAKTFMPGCKMPRVETGSRYDVAKGHQFITIVGTVD